MQRGSQASHAALLSVSEVGETVEIPSVRIAEVSVDAFQTEEMTQVHGVLSSLHTQMLHVSCL